ncbi:hypothetical protein DM02DRAFT_557027 [Periconia macrospinosa]|uniref:C2H2-type domain-containing protein n=1 Tax=Periconia macrospinosa TaxID=97972 RepID=A0A2V1E137_9PLEO|nr:hypothetical protein DM02DRAFT_557027 [Periconia macrospinosa]
MRPSPSTILHFTCTERVEDWQFVSGLVDTAIDRSWTSRSRSSQNQDPTMRLSEDYECGTCEKRFATRIASVQHMNSKQHWPECETCDKCFYTQASAEQHMKEVNHFKNPFCDHCNRFFHGQNAYKMHLNSKYHRGKAVPCPFCQAKFTTASGLSHHLERSACHLAKSVTKVGIYKTIHRRDTKRLITDEDIDPSTVVEIETIATEAAWNNRAFECYFCHREFKTLNRLNQHLHSGIHSHNHPGELYHCMNFNCPRTFDALGALFAHLESESCAFVKFLTVQRNVEQFFTSNRRIRGFVPEV